MTKEPIAEAEDGGPTTRRRLLRTAGALGAVGLTASVFGELTGGRAIAATLRASDVSLSSDDGTITGLTVEPSVDVTWSGLDAPPQSVVLTTIVSDPNDAQVAHTFAEQQFDASSSTYSGSQTVPMTTQSILGGTPFRASDFESTNDGQTNERSVRVEVGVRMELADGTSAESTAGPAEYLVRTTNAATTVSSSGTANTGGSA